MNAGTVRVEFDAVSKRFRRGTRHGALRDVLASLTRRVVDPQRDRREPFWALRDVSFEVDSGHALGIIGPNGSGKSTVLRLLAGILRPDAGRVLLPDCGRRPRIGALIELAAGFHYELTGRENVFLQGAILGMRRSEISRKFDEIVEFAGVADFIDTPVRHYSSGMNARLGFAIAAHLDPDVLIIDEVLAVGDEAFQRKAFARLAQSVRRQIPTIVVSHQLHRVVELCDRAILLTGGRVVAAGSPAECVQQYVGSAGVPGEPDDEAPVRITSIAAAGPTDIEPGQRIRLRIRGIVSEPGCAARASAGVRVRALPLEELVFIAHSAAGGLRLPELGEFEIEIDVRMNVSPGSYRAQAVVWDLQSRRESTRGPSVIIGVGGPHVQDGRVFADPRFRSIEP